MDDKSLKVLVVDDEPQVLTEYEERIRTLGHTCLPANMGKQACQLCKENDIDVALVDYGMPIMNGIQTGKRLRELNLNIVLVMLTAYGAQYVIEAMESGFDDYLVKPTSQEQLKVAMLKARRLRDNRLETYEVREQFEQSLSRHVELLGHSSVMKKVITLANQAAKTDCNVLITGASGTGKEQVARHIHLASNRSGNPFVPINCGILTETLLESALFGHEKGSATGINSRRKGRFELADSGTLFLDEVAECSERLQIGLLRVLEEKEFFRVGGERSVKVNVRIISATHQNLKDLIERKSFRNDLYYRLNVFPIELPLLSERREDIPILSKFFLDTYSHKYEKNNLEISQSALELLVSAPWIGNVRELKNCIERAVVKCDSNVIQMEHVEGMDVECQDCEIDMNVGGRPRTLVWAKDIEKIDQQTVYQNIDFCFAYLDKHGNPPKYLKDLETFILELKGTKPGKSRPRTFGQHLYQNSADWVRIIRDNRASLNPIVPILILCDSIEKRLREKGIL